MSAELLAELRSIPVAEQADEFPVYSPYPPGDLRRIPLWKSALWVILEIALAAALIYCIGLHVK